MHTHAYAYTLAPTNCLSPPLPFLPLSLSIFSFLSLSLSLLFSLSHTHTRTHNRGRQRICAAVIGRYHKSLARLESHYHLLISRRRTHACCLVCDLEALRSCDGDIQDEREGGSSGGGRRGRGDGGKHRKEEGGRHGREERAIGHRGEEVGMQEGGEGERRGEERERDSRVVGVWSVNRTGSWELGMQGMGGGGWHMSQHVCAFARCMFAYIHARTHIHKCKHTCIHTYIHTYIHTLSFFFSVPFSLSFSHVCIYTHTHYLEKVYTHVSLLTPSPHLLHTRTRQILNFASVRF